MMCRVQMPDPEWSDHYMSRSGSGRILIWKQDPIHFGSDFNLKNTLGQIQVFLNQDLARSWTQLVIAFSFGTSLLIIHNIFWTIG